MHIDTAIKLFACFLNDSWSSANKFADLADKDESVINDWLQANWELLVERNVLRPKNYLEIYGDGADLNGASSRITEPDAINNYNIKLMSKNNGEVTDFLNNKTITLSDMRFDKIVGFKEGFYVMSPEFKYILIFNDDSNEESVVLIDEIRFELESL